jgi:hypothetical protein
MIYWDQAAGAVADTTSNGASAMAAVLDRPASKQRILTAEYMEEIIAQGQPIYERMRAQWLKDHRGQFVLINVTNGQPVFGKSELEVSDRFVEEFGEDTPGYLNLVE